MSMIVFILIWTAALVLLLTAMQHRRHAMRTDTRLCPACGDMAPRHARFCRSCGRKL